MIPYMFLIFTVILEGIFFYFSKKNNKSKIIFLSIVCIELILFAGFRSVDIGVDTKNYLYALHYYKKLPINEIFAIANPWNIDYEIGYMLLTKISASLQLSDTSFFILIASFIYIPVSKYIYEESDDVVISMLFYLCFELFAYSLGIFRQMISISILLLAIKYVKKRQIFKFMIIVLIAMSFHYSAVVAIPLYFVYNKKFKKIYLYYLIIIEVLIIFFGTKIIELLFGILGKYTHYIGSKYAGSGGGYTLIFVLHILLMVGLLMYSRYGNSKKVHSKNRKTEREYLEIQNNDFYLFIIAFAIILTALAHTFSIISRSNCLYIMMIEVYVPFMIRKVSTPHTRIIIKIIAVTLLVIYFYFSIVGEPRLNPFIFI